MANVPSDRRAAGLVLTLTKNSFRSPWLDSVKAATGVDPRLLSTDTTCLLLDTSSSMLGAPIREAIKGARRFNADCINAGQSVGLVCFSSHAEVAAECSRAGIAPQLAGVSCGGSTNMASAIKLALQHLANTSGRRTMVIATDGHPDDPSAAIAAAACAKQARVRILTIGTTGCDVGFLAKIASSADLAAVTATGALGKAIAKSACLLLK